MWVGTEFPGDTNELLKKVQNDLYWTMVVRLYTPPRDRYLDACRLVQANTDLANRLRSMEGFDHRTLQDIHDLIGYYCPTPRKGLIGIEKPHPLSANH